MYQIITKSKANKNKIELIKKGLLSDYSYYLDLLIDKASNNGMIKASINQDNLYIINK